MSAHSSAHSSAADSNAMSDSDLPAHTSTTTHMSQSALPSFRRTQASFVPASVTNAEQLILAVESQDESAIHQFAVRSSPISLTAQSRQAGRSMLALASWALARAHGIDAMVQRQLAQASLPDDIWAMTNKQGQSILAELCSDGWACFNGLRGTLIRQALRVSFEPALVQQADGSLPLMTLARAIRHETMPHSSFLVRMRDRQFTVISLELLLRLCADSTMPGIFMTRDKSGKNFAELLLSWPERSESFIRLLRVDENILKQVDLYAIWCHPHFLQQMSLDPMPMAHALLEKKWLRLQQPTYSNAIQVHLIKDLTGMVMKYLAAW
jgi:hypothetical protein